MADGTRQLTLLVQLHESLHQYLREERKANDAERGPSYNPKGF